MLLLAGGRTVLIDCPDPFFRVCAEASAKSGRKIDPAQIDHIVLTHLHGDHSNGLEGFGFWRKFSSSRKIRPTLYTSYATAAGLWPKLEPSMREAVFRDKPKEIYGLSDYFDLRAFEFGDRFEACGIQFETRRTIHSIPCFGFRASFGGRKFGYSCDTSYDPEHIKFLSPCDLIFHECDTGFHTPIEALEALPKEFRDKTRLIHLNDAFAGSSKVEAAEEGRVYVV